MGDRDLLSKARSTCSHGLMQTRTGSTWGYRWGGGGQFHCFSGFPRYLRLSAGTKSEAATSGVEVAGVVLPGMGCGYGGVCVANPGQGSGGIKVKQAC